MTALFIIGGVFLGLMVPAFLISAMPGLTIKIMETARLYRKGSLTCGTENFIAGSGHYRRGSVYTFRDERGNTRFDSGRVFGRLVLIFLPLFTVMSLVVYYFLAGTL